MRVFSWRLTIPFDCIRVFFFIPGSQQIQNICITFVQRRPSVFDVGPTLCKCYTNVLCLLGLPLCPCHPSLSTAASLAPVAETGFSHRLSAYKIVGFFFGLSYRNISLNNQVENSFFRISNISLPCPHAQLGGRTVIKKVWTFSNPGVKIALSHRYVEFFWVKQIHKSTASERTTRLLPAELLQK